MAAVAGLFANVNRCLTLGALLFPVPWFLDYGLRVAISLGGLDVLHALGIGLCLRTLRVDALSGIRHFTANRAPLALGFGIRKGFGFFVGHLDFGGHITNGRMDVAEMIARVPLGRCCEPLLRNSDSAFLTSAR